MTEYRDWSITASANTGSSANGFFAENMNYSEVNNAAREMQAILARNLKDKNGTLAAGGSTGSYVLSPSMSIGSYRDGDYFRFRANVKNAGATTLQVSTLSARPVVKTDLSALANGDIIAGGIYEVFYRSDSANFQLSNPSLTSGSVGVKLYPRSAEEIAGSVTPSDYSYEPGDIRRYGAVFDSSTLADMDANNAALAALVSAFANTGIAARIRGGDELHFDEQWSIASGANVSCRLSIIQDPNCKLMSHVTGSVSGYDSAGFAILTDGWRDSQWYGLRLDYSSGTAGVCVRCRNQSAYNNKFIGPHIEGGSAILDRETATKITFRFVGNEAGASSTGYANYHNVIETGHLNIGHKHVECVVGDGSAGTSQPNAQIIANTLFARYVYGVDYADTDEQRMSNCWFTLAGTLDASAGGDAGTNSIDVRLEGVYSDLSYTSEPGAGGKPYHIGASATENRLVGVFNNATGGTVESTAEGDNLIMNRARMDGLKRLNHLSHDTDGEQDIYLFGDGTNAHSGAGKSALYVFDSGGETRTLKVGWNTFGKMDLLVSNGAHLNLGGTYQNPIMLNGAYLWTNAGVLYINTSAPANATDGTVVGAQT